MVVPGVEKCDEVAGVPWLVDATDGSRRGVRRARRASGCGRRGSSLTVGRAGGRTVSLDGPGFGGTFGRAGGVSTRGRAVRSASGTAGAGAGTGGGTCGPRPIPSPSASGSFWAFGLTQ